jgi:beta-lactam-binding protein with PASTA domain
VTVPLVVGLTVDAARSRLATQPLGSDTIGVPAKTGTRPGFVIKQEPRSGFLSAGDSVRLYVTRPDPRYGLVPNLVGSSLADARARLGKGSLKLRVVYGKGTAGTVVEQTPQAGVAAGPGLKVKLVVGRATPTATP